MALAVLTVAGYRVALTSGVISARTAAAALPVFTSRCAGTPVLYPILQHPIVTFGDSITEGYGATDKCLPREVRSILPESAHLVHTGDTSYPGDLARMLHRAVLNYGVGGETTKEGVPRLKAVLRAVHPSTVVILEGINDLWAGRRTDDVSANLSQMVHAVKASGAQPILLTVLPVDRPVFSHAQKKVDTLNVAIQAMAWHEAVTFVDVAALFQTERPRSRLFRHADGREDGVHPNDAGYRLLAEGVSKALR